MAVASRLSVVAAMTTTTHTVRVFPRGKVERTYRVYNALLA
jgi:hypothetical protein